MMLPTNNASVGVYRSADFPYDLDTLVEDRVAEGIFRVNRKVFTDRKIFEAEVLHIFESTWLFIGLESQIPKPHDFTTIVMGRQPVILMRDSNGKLGAFYNSCKHRGAVVCPYRSGNQRVHVCRYHGWSYGSDGRNSGVAQSKDGQYPAAFAKEDHGLTPIAKLESYRGFIFGSLSADVPSLQEHLGEARAILDLVVDQSPQGVEYVPGGVTYTFDANWKLQFENGLDYYHFGTTHASYMDVMQHRLKTGAVEQPRTYEDAATEEAAGSYGFERGHALMYAIRKQGRVHVRPLANDPGALEEIRARVGETKAKWMLRQRNLTIYPNLQIVDISSQQLRTWRPLAPNKTEMVSHCLAPIGEGEAAREMRIRNYEDFFNPTGLGSSDDNLMYEYVQAGYEASEAGDTQGYVRGLGQAVAQADPFARELGISPESWAYGPITFGDESCMQGGYREWRRLIARGLERQRANNKDIPIASQPCEKP
ncbi:ring hydroxylating alpha subunit family protein (plasmid) [Burkholderia cepacia]|nr:ring hydroxylating alpha subunit family protein [Burkholderia cepacia]